MINNFYQRIKNKILKLPLTVWVLLGFLLTFYLFFIVPVFFDPLQKMRFIEYILVLSPIGHDFNVLVSASSTWLHSGALPATLYPPVILMFFVPFTFLNEGAGYRAIVLLILFCYVLTTLILPRRINGSKGLSALGMLVFISGLVSYGLQFELERGQWNLIAFTFCLTAIYIFHHHPDRRWLAYLLFTISIQLKLYPAIFVFAMIEDWSDWRNNIKRFVGLGLVNVAALFMFGLGPILSMFGSQGNIEAAHVGRNFNLSISSFILNLLSLSFLPHRRIILWLQANSWLPQSFLFALFAVCFLIILRQAYKHNSKGLNPSVFLACTIGACLIPSISFDYKLSFFPASVMLLLPVFRSFEKGRQGFSIIFLTLLFSIAYSSMLYSYANKPEIFQYDLPALFVLLGICILLAFVRSDEIAEPLENAPEAGAVGQ